MDVYLSTRKEFGVKKIWSEKLEVDLMRASMFRIARRGDLKKKMRKPYEAWDSEKGKWKPKPNRFLGETAEDPIDVDDKKSWYGMGLSMVLTLSVMVGYFFTSVNTSKYDKITWRTFIYGAEWGDEQQSSNVNK